MKISMLTLLMSNFSLERCFSMLSAQGYDGIEIWGARPHAYPYDMDHMKIEKILSWKEKYQLEISMYTPELLAYPYNLASSDKKEREETITYLRRAIEVAAAMGTERMQITCGHCGYMTDKKQAWEKLVDGMMRIADIAEKENVSLIIEALSPSEGNMITRCDDILELKHRVGSPKIKAMIDMVTPVIQGEAFGEYFEKFGKDMDYIHCIDSDGATLDHLLPGSGVIPFAETIQLFKDYGYDGWLSGERISGWDQSVICHQYINQLKQYL